MFIQPYRVLYPTADFSMYLKVCVASSKSWPKHMPPEIGIEGRRRSILSSFLDSIGAIWCREKEEDCMIRQRIEEPEFGSCARHRTNASKADALNAKSRKTASKQCPMTDELFCLSSWGFFYRFIQLWKHFWFEKVTVHYFFVTLRHRISYRGKTQSVYIQTDLPIRFTS